MGSINFQALKEQGKTIIYKESETELVGMDWELWGKRTTESSVIYVYRKIVTFEEAEQNQLENELLK